MDWNFISSLHSINRELPMPLLAGTGGGPARTDGDSEQGRLDPDRPLRAVIVEDELFAAWFIEGMLEKLGHQVIDIYSTGEEALSADFADVDLVIVDVNLGRGMDGVDTAAALRGSYPLSIVFCSAYSDEGTRQRVTEAVPTATFVNKPLTERDLRTAIEAVLQPKH